MERHPREPNRILCAGLIESYFDSSWSEIMLEIRFDRPIDWEATEYGLPVVRNLRFRLHGDLSIECRFHRVDFDFGDGAYRLALKPVTIGQESDPKHTYNIDNMFIIRKEAELTGRRWWQSVKEIERSWFLCPEQSASVPNAVYIESVHRMMTLSEFAAEERTVERLCSEMSAFCDYADSAPLQE